MPASCLNFFKGIKHGVGPGVTAIHCRSEPARGSGGQAPTGFSGVHKAQKHPIPVGAAAGCDLLLLIFKGQGKRSQPAAAPTGHRSMPASCLNCFKGIKHGVGPGSPQFTVGVSLLAIAECQAIKMSTDPPPSLAGKLPQVSVVSKKLKNTPIPVGAAAGCDLLILIFQGQGKRSQPAAAPTGHRSMPASCLNLFKGIKHGVGPRFTAIHCRSEPARDSGVSGNKDVD
ncbi:hypothetical protein BW33_01108 [Pseudomonas sp. RIT288]|nr:hypothetical protein BW33_01108 [Pseudomonas sp. RIT288]